MRKTPLVHDDYAFQQLPDDLLRLILGSLHLHVIAEVAMLYVFHRDVKAIMVLIPPEKFHKQSIMQFML